MPFREILITCFAIIGFCVVISVVCTLIWVALKSIQWKVQEKKRNEDYIPSKSKKDPITEFHETLNTYNHE